VRLLSSHNFSVGNCYKFLCMDFVRRPQTNHTHTLDGHFSAAVAGSRIKGVIWLKAISKAGVHLHSNTSLYLSSFCVMFYHNDGFLLQ
jgi:hypothetical protein